MNLSLLSRSIVVIKIALRTISEINFYEIKIFAK